MKLKHFGFLLSLLLLISCSKDKEEEVLVSKISIDYTYKVRNDRVLLDASPSFSEESEELVYTWDSSDPRIFINNKNGKQAYFVFPDQATKSEVEIILNVDDGITNETKSVNIEIPAFNDHIKEWGLGDLSQDRMSNNVYYSWYIDQKNTGRYSADNCGPSCVTMALKWHDESFDKTAEYARSQYRSSGGWWYTSDIFAYLSDNHAKNYGIPLQSKEDLMEELDKGHIAIICLDMHIIRRETNSRHRIDKYYNTNPDWGHFLVVKGYRKVDNITFFEIYDPNSWGQTYSDNSLKGINRYYRASDIMRSTNSWWKYAIIISKEKTKSLKAIDPASIEHAWGR